MARANLWDLFGISKASDLKYLFSWGLVPAVMGTTGLAVIGVPEFRRVVRPYVGEHVWDFASDWVLALVILLVILTLLPQQLSRARLHLRQREVYRRKDLELFIASSNLRFRLLHLITKFKEVLRGHVRNEFQTHTLKECCDFFQMRFGHEVPESRGEGANFHAVYMTREATATGQTYFQRTSLFTHHDPESCVKKVTGTQADGRRVVKSLMAGNHEYLVGDDAKKAMRSFGAPANTEFSVLLGVPVFKDRKLPGDDRIRGALFIMGTDSKGLRESDHPLLGTYAGMLSVAYSLEEEIS